MHHASLTCGRRSSVPFGFISFAPPADMTVDDCRQQNSSDKSPRAERAFLLNFASLARQLEKAVGETDRAECRAGDVCAFVRSGEPLMYTARPAHGMTVAASLLSLHPKHPPSVPTTAPSKFGHSLARVGAGWHGRGASRRGGVGRYWQESSPLCWNHQATARRSRGITRRGHRSSGVLQ